jgi:hypothetical protein
MLIRVRGFCRLLPTSIVVLLTIVSVAAAVPTEISQYLDYAGFAAPEIASLDNGTVIARVMPGGSETEVFTVAAVKIRSTRAQTLSYYGQMVAYVDGQVTKGFGRFSNPPALADVAALSLDANDIASIKACKPRDCDIRIGAAAMNTLRASIDWNAPDAAAQVNARARQALVDYVGAYMKNGNAALVTYNDRSEPVSASEQWRGVLASSPYFRQYGTALHDYLEQYPRATLPGAKDVIYWVKEDYAGLSPVVSVVHGVIYEDPGRPDRVVVAQKQLYASHYYDGSLALATLLSPPDAGAGPTTYLIYANRSRGDLLKGGFGGLKSRIARDQAKKSAEQTLGTIKMVLEGR